MSSTTGGKSDLQAISDLLRSGQEAQEDRYETAVAREKMLTPGSIGPPPKSIRNEFRLDPKAIWTEDEASEAQDPFYDPDDPRPQPEYDVVYKQSVMTEDAFLGMAGKTPGSKDCTHIVVKIVFPGCRMSDLDVDVTRSSIMAASPKLRLATCLPHPVDEAQGDAAWNSKTYTLAVTLPILPEVW